MSQGTTTGRTSSAASNQSSVPKSDRKQYAILNWAYYHGPNVQRLATISALVVGTVSLVAVTVKYVVS